MTAPGRNGTALVIGEALVDVIINPGEPPRDIPGGSPANVALGLARLGRDAELDCWIGRDERGLAVREHLEATGVRTAYMDGSTPDRQKVIDAFRAGEADVFLISLKAGGFGLTLTEADYVFLLDPWWNPQAEEQAVDRTHRIGQDKPVMVYRLVSADTIEEKVMALKEKKAELFARVVEGAGEAEAGGEGAAGAGAAGSGGLSPAALTAAEIRELIEG